LWRSGPVICAGAGLPSLNPGEDAVLDDLGLAPAIASLVQDLREHTEITGEFETDGFDQRLSPQTEVVLYRIAQEALTNVARHAQAHRVLVSLARDGQLVRLSVEDDGVGFDAASRRDSGGLGLFGMQERLGLVGGSLRIDSRPGEGTRVVAEVPQP
jgi:two-component system sensor histidine kinase UhpB